MLSQDQINELKEHLEKAQNPLFFFDNDNDGLMSFLILRRYINRGKGVPIKSFPDLNASYYRKVQELKSDYIFILDKPVVSGEFLEKAQKDSLPVVWIDHHQVDTLQNTGYYYYNPYTINKTNEPVSYQAYKTTGKKEDMWLAIIGCISDCYLPDFYEEFQQHYPDLTKKNPTGPFDIVYNTEIGRISRILDYSLKDTTTNVIKMLKFMTTAHNPADILEENSRTKQIHKRYDEINTHYQNLIKKARQLAQEKTLYFQYGGNLSLSANLANQLTYEYPNKLIVVVYIKGDLANISLRGKRDIRKLTLQAIEGIEGATGGGHENATGAKMSVSDLPVFKERIEKLLKG